MGKDDARGRRRQPAQDRGRAASAIEKGRDEWEEKLPLFRVTEYSIDGRGGDTYYRQLPGVDHDFWDKAETLAIRAIEEYAAGSRNGDRFRRNLFAEDATRGFAFIDLCRKRLDIVLMNPPFGAMSLAAKKDFERAYPRTKNDVYAAFVEMGLRPSSGRIAGRDHVADRLLPHVVPEMAGGDPAWRGPADRVRRPGLRRADTAMVETAAYCLVKCQQTVRL